MKKILVLNNDYLVPENSLDFAIQLAGYEGSTIVGLFVQSLKKSDEESYVFSDDIISAETDITGTTEQKENLEFEKRNIQLFSDTCATSNIPFKTQSIYQNFLDTLVDHSAFADIIICDADRLPRHYSLNTLLVNSHCPVLLVNKDFKKIDTIVFTYDDKSSSIHAIKLFTYLFGFYQKLPVHVVSVVPNNVLGIEYEDLIKEWLYLHYPDVTIEVLKGDIKDELSKFINTVSDPLIVMGAFGRSALSRFFKESLANIILGQTNAPLFIVHD